MDLDVDQLDKQFMNVTEAAKKLITSEAIIRGMIDSNELPAYKFHRGILIRTADLEEFTRTHMMEKYMAGRTGRKK